MSANLILHWALDRLETTPDGSGVTTKKVLNRIKNNLNGLISGNTTVVSDTKFGSCFQFDGDQDGIELNNHSSLDVDSYTIEGWIKPTSIDSSVTKKTIILNKGSDNYGIFLDKNGYIEHKFKVRSSDGSTSTGSHQTSNGSIVWDRWQHVAITNNGTNARIYINGQLANESSITGSIDVDTNSLVVAKHNLYKDYEGKIAHIRLYNRVLTPQQINGDIQQDESLMSPNLILHWALDRLETTPDGSGVTTKKVLNRIKNNLNGLISGNTTVVSDTKFGSCFQFDGDQDGIELSNHSSLEVYSYTIEGWIKPSLIDSSVTKKTIILNKGSDNYGIFLDKNGYIEHKFKVRSIDGSTSTRSHQTSNGSIVWDKWQHVAITNNRTSARIYINGQLANESSITGSIDIDVDTNSLVVAKHSSYKDYEGKIAHIRLYDRVLTPQQINGDILLDETAFSAFVRKYPIDFELYTRDSQHVLFIEDASINTPLYLDITNSSLKDIQLEDIGSDAASSNYHFELRFRSGTLDSKQLASINVVGSDWSLNHKSDGTALYLLYKGSNRLLKAGNKITLQFNTMSADARGGNRSARVELIYKNIKYHSDANLLQGYRLQHLNIINHVGRRNLPLHVGFVGGNTILSDGKTLNNLKLRISNTRSNNPLVLKSGTKSSRIRISFDIQSPGKTAEWAITESTSANSILLNVTDENGSSINFLPLTKKTQGNTLEWTITPKNDISIEDTKTIIINIQSLIGLKSVGHTNIYINFDNIPNYQDEQIILNVEKSPILYSNTNVSIGTNDLSSKYELFINGDLGVRSDLKVKGKLIVGDHGYITANQYFIKQTTENEVSKIESSLSDISDLGSIANVSNSININDKTLLIKGSLGKPKAPNHASFRNIELRENVYISGDLKVKDYLTTREFFTTTVESDYLRLKKIQRRVASDDSLYNILVLDNNQVKFIRASLQVI